MTPHIAVTRWWLRWTAEVEYRAAGMGMRVVQRGFLTRRAARRWALRFAAALTR